MKQTERKTWQTEAKKRRKHFKITKTVRTHKAWHTTYKLDTTIYKIDNQQGAIFSIGKFTQVYNGLYGERISKSGYMYMCNWFSLLHSRK